MVKVSAVFVDLSSTYDTVWREGLLLKLARVIKCKTIMRLLSCMTGARQYQTVLGDDRSKWRTLKNGVPQGSVLATTLFNVNLSDLPEVRSTIFRYADDWALAYQSKSKAHLEDVMSRDIQLLEYYFGQWCLKMNISKSISAYFHLNNREANETLKIQTANGTLPADKNPKYLGVTLDRSLTYRKHIDSVVQKLKKRNNSLRKISGTTW